jgi:class 3 adenylate cyclase
VHHERLRTELERHGGTVEKFIGDAVVALFGAPVAHEDDPERAVRAALAVQDAIPQLNEANPALACFCAAERLIARGKREEGRRSFERALAFYRQAGATLYIEQTEALMAPSG